MKNSTILKDELSIFKADKSAVLAELRLVVEQLKDAKIELSALEREKADVELEIKEDLFRRDKLREQVKAAAKELEESTQGVKNMRSSFETLKLKNTQEEKLHLGRIKDLNRKKEEIEEKAEAVKQSFDKNHSVYSETLREQERVIRENKNEIKEAEAALKFVTSNLDKATSEEKKLLKERLKREDKIRAREKALEIKESVNEKKEQDLETMAKDILIVYGRLKELYAKVDPTVDLDKIIINAA